MPVGALKDGDAVAPVVELVSHSQTGGAAAHHGHPLAGAHLGDAGLHEAVGVAILNDGSTHSP